MKTYFFAGAMLCLLACVSCSPSNRNGTAGGTIIGSKSLPESSCPAGGQITIIVGQGQETTVPIYVGSDSKTYRITAIGESVSLAETLQMEIVLNGDPKNPVPFYAFINNGSTGNSASNSVDVQSQRIELTYNNVPVGYQNSLAQFCFYRIQ